MARRYMELMDVYIQQGRLTAAGSELQICDPSFQGVVVISDDLTFLEEVPSSHNRTRAASWAHRPEASSHDAALSHKGGYELPSLMPGKRKAGFMSPTPPPRPTKAEDFVSITGGTVPEPPPPPGQSTQGWSEEPGHEIVAWKLSESICRPGSTPTPPPPPRSSHYPSEDDCPDKNQWKSQGSSWTDWSPLCVRN